LDGYRDRPVSGGRSQLGRYLRHRATRELVKRVGAAKLAVAGAVACLALVLGLALLAVLVGAGASSSSALGQSCVARLGKSSAPPALVPLYAAAAREFGLGPRGPGILAAINKVESDYGRSTLPGVHAGSNSKGAEGPMQFLQGSWQTFGVDGNGDGVKDPYDETDAVFAAARLLRAEGAPGDWYGAIFAYNHADWYVREVERIARRLAIGGAGEAEACVASAPPDAALAQMLAEADRIDRLHLVYVWGGSHGTSPTPPNGPFDCSSAVSHLLQVGGFGNPTLDTVGLGRWGEPGSGRWLTIFVRPYAGAQGHVFVEFGPSVAPPQHRYWGTSTSNPGGGPGWIPQGALSAAYLRGFQRRHPPGL
jgi:Transglycosylase SLT domain